MIIYLVFNQQRFIPLSDSSLICTVPAHWLVILDTLIAFTFYIYVECDSVIMCLFVDLSTMVANVMHPDLGPLFCVSWAIFNIYV